MQSPGRSAMIPGGLDDPQPRDSRTFTLLLVAHVAREDGRDGLCRVRNVSPGGLMADVVMHIREGEAVRVDLRNGQSRAGVVRWVKDGQFGMQFDEPLADVQAFLAEPDRAVRADGVPVIRSPRLDAECSASLLLDGRHYPGTVCDLSQGGARLVTSAPADRDRLLTLSVPGLPSLRTVVRWSDLPSIGVSFLDHLSYAALARWLEDDRMRFSRRG